MTGVQTCALPIFSVAALNRHRERAFELLLLEKIEVVSIPARDVLSQIAPSFGLFSKDRKTFVDSYRPVAVNEFASFKII